MTSSINTSLVESRIMDYSLINLRLQSDRANHQVLYFNHGSVNKPCHHNATYLPSYVYTYTNVTRPMFFSRLLPSQPMLAILKLKDSSYKLTFTWILLRYGNYDTNGE